MVARAPRPRWLAPALSASLSLIVLGLVGLFFLSRSGDGLPRYGQMPAFTLTDQAGQPFSSQQLQGKILAVGFIYTSCTDICPMVTDRMVKLQTALQKQGLDVQLISISVDPERDTPDVLARYAGQHQADLHTWHFLTGDLAHIRSTVVDGFLAGYQKEPGHDHADGGYEVTHSGRVILVDRTGQMRAFYRGEELDPARVIADIRSLH